MLLECFIIITEVSKQKLPVLVVLAQNKFDSIGMEKKEKKKRKKKKRTILQAGGGGAGERE